MSSDFCVKCDRELAVYCGPCVDAVRAEIERLQRELTDSELAREALRIQRDEARAERDHFKEIARQRSEDFLAANAERVQAVLKANNPSREVPCGHCGTKFMAEEFTCGDCMDEVDEKYFVEAMQDAALEQREACAERMRLTVDSNAEHLCRTTPLVTEGEP